MRKCFLMAASALCIIMLVAGCTTQAPSPPTTSQPTISEQKNATSPGIVQTQQTPQTPVTTPVPDTTRIQTQTTPTNATPAPTPTTEPSLRRAEPAPYVNSIGFDSYYFSFDIPGCDMKEIYPAYANDPEYGIEQSVPKLSTRICSRDTCFYPGPYPAIEREFPVHRVLQLPGGIDVPQLELC